MAAAYAVMAAALVGPLLVFHRSAYVSEGVPRPAWVQYASLVSPLMSVENLQTPSEFVRSHPAVVGGLGPHGGVKATAGLYALAAAALLRAGRRVPSGRSPGGVTHTEAR
jgi:hypothetical protein